MTPTCNYTRLNRGRKREKFMKSMMFNSVSCVLATAVLMATPVYAQKGAIQDSYAAVVKKALPAVVNISTSRIVRSPRGGELPQLPDFFDFFGFGGPGGRDFGPAPAPRERRTQSLGSGVVVSADGYILTNNHVVEEATDITVAFDDRREFSAKLIGGDALSDIALLKVEGTGFAPLPMGNSDSIEVGDICLAIGNPFGLKSTVTMGIISATGRGGLGIETYEDFIQTDAAINPGNSGGAMINTRGELIGINTAILSRTGGNQGIGFAIPINMARDIMGQIRDTGKVSRGYMGAGIQDLTPELAKAFDLSSANGVAITQVEQDSPAQQAGLQPGDVVVSVNGNAVKTANELRLRISGTKPGETVKLGVQRNGKPVTLAVTLKQLPSQRGDEESSGGGGGGEPSALEGLSVDDLTPQIAQQLGLGPEVKGVVVTNIDPSSEAAGSGLARGDVIQSVNRRPVTSVAEFRKLFSSTAGQPVLLLVNRRGATRFVVVTPQGGNR